MGLQNWLQFKKFELWSGCQKIKLDQVPYGEPRYWLICRSLLNRHLTITSVGYVLRVNMGRTSTNVGQYIDRDIVDSLPAEAYWSNTGQLLVNYWWYTGQLLVLYQLLVEK